jgi:hypothetical protein
MSFRTQKGLWQLFAIACAAFLAMGEAQAQDPRATEVQAAARSWLALVDGGDTQGSWKAGGKRFQNEMSAEQWSEAYASARGPLGPVTSRATVATRFQQTLPDGPQGEYALVIYESTFEKAGVGRENVTLEREPDGVWRVIGYYIH